MGVLLARHVIGERVVIKADVVQNVFAIPLVGMVGGVFRNAVFVVMAIHLVGSSINTTSTVHSLVTRGQVHVLKTSLIHTILIKVRMNILRDSQI